MPHTPNQENPNVIRPKGALDLVVADILNRLRVHFDGLCVAISSKNKRKLYVACKDNEGQ